MPIYRTGANIYTVVQLWGQPTGGAANTANYVFQANIGEQARVVQRYMSPLRINVPAQFLTTTTSYNETGLSITATATVTCTDRAHFRQASYFRAPSLLSYDFTETGTTVTDRSGNGRNATLSPSDLHSSGQLLISAAGQRLSYTPDAAALPQYASVTMKFTTPSNVAGAGNGEINLWSKMRVSNSSNFNLYIESAKLSAIVRGTTVVGPSIITTAGPTMADNTTYGAALTYDGTTTRLYLNGVEFTTATAAQGPLDMTGADTTWSTGDAPLDTTTVITDPYLIDDIRFFDYALTTAEVAYAATTPVLVGLADLSITSTATVTVADTYHAGSAGYNETGRSIPIAATTTVPIERVGNKELTLSIPIVGAITVPTEKAGRKELALSLPITAATTVPSQRAGNKELVLSLPIAATVTCTDTFGHFGNFVETNRSITIAASTTAVDQADLHETALSIPVAATVTITDTCKRRELNLSIPIAGATTLPVDRAGYKNLSASLLIVGVVTCSDNQSSPGHYDETQRSILISATTTLAVDQADFDQLGLSVPAAATVTATVVLHRFETTLSVPLAVTTAVTDRLHLYDPLSVLIAATFDAVSQADYEDHPVSIIAAATVSLTIEVAGRHELAMPVGIVSTVSSTSRSSYRQLALPVDVSATVSMGDSLHGVMLLAMLIVARITCTDARSRTGIVKLNDADALFLGDEEVFAVYVGADRAWP